jgi:hypothetical protein
VAVGGGVMRASSEGFFSGEDDDSLPDLIGPGDSHSEMSGGPASDPGDSNVELPAFDDAAPSGTFEAASSEVVLPGPWYDQVIDSWNRWHFLLTLGFGISALGLLGYFLVEAVLGGKIVNTSVTALIVGCVGTVAFLLLSASVTALIVVVVDLGRNVRRLLTAAPAQGARIAGH